MMPTLARQALRAAATGLLMAALASAAPGPRTTSTDATSEETVSKDGGSVTLTSGILSEQPIRYGASASLVNGGLESFVRAAAIELPRGIRINVVSPNVLAEAMPAYAPYFRGFDAVPGAKVALAYSRSVEGAQTGQVYKVY